MLLMVVNRQFPLAQSMLGTAEQILVLNRMAVILLVLCSDNFCCLRRFSLRSMLGIPEYFIQFSLWKIQARGCCMHVFLVFTFTLHTSFYAPITTKVDFREGRPYKNITKSINGRKLSLLLDVYIIKSYCKFTLVCPR